MVSNAFYSMKAKRTFFIKEKSSFSRLYFSDNKACFWLSFWYNVEGKCKKNCTPLLFYFLLNRIMTDVKIWELLNQLSFSNKEVAEFVGVSESMVKKIRTGSSLGSPAVQNRIQEFVRSKVQKVNERIKSKPLLFSVDDV